MARTQPAASEARRSAHALAAAFNKKHGPGTVVVASSARIKPTRQTTGSVALDVTMHGGWPTNQWSEIVGLEGSGKTTAVLKTVAAAQAADPEHITVWVAAESYDEDYATMLGVDNSRVILIEENVMEVAYEIVLGYAANRACDMVVIDSLPALVPADEDEKTMEEWSPGAGARRTNQFMRKATKATKRSLVDEDRPFVGIVINQWREKIGVLHGDPRTTPGGKAKNYWFYARIEVRRDEWILDEQKDKVGQTIVAKTIKMKGARPGAPTMVDFYFADHAGITAGSYDAGKETLNLSLHYDIVQRRGSTYVYRGQRFIGGKAGFAAALDADPALFANIRKEVLDAARGDIGHAGDEEDELDAPTVSVARRR